MFRVVKPGGTVGMAAWGDYGVQGEIFQALADYAPPPDQDLPVPREWGDAAVVEQRLGPRAASLRAERRTLRYEYDTIDDLWEVFLAAGPGAAARNAMPPDVIAQARERIGGIVEQHNLASDGRVALEAEYLEIVARKRG
jgi:hypothetical protein